MCRLSTVFVQVLDECIHTSSEYTILKFQDNALMTCTVAFDALSLFRGILDSEEISKLRAALETDGGILQHAYFVNDGHGRRSKLCIWSHPGHDITGMVARSEKVVGTMENVSIVDAFWTLLTSMQFF